MRVLGALVLVLLGLGIFPFNAQVLTSLPGAFLAALSVSLFFFAYRMVARGKSKTGDATEKSNS